MAMDEVYWSFGLERYKNYEMFVLAVTEYNDDVAEGEHEWDPEAVVCSGPCKIQYEAGWKDEDYLLEVVVTAEDGPVKMGRLLYKLHVDSFTFFENCDHHFFEGLEEISPGTYELYIGS